MQGKQEPTTKTLILMHVTCIGDTLGTTHKSYQKFNHVKALISFCRGLKISTTHQFRQKHMISFQSPI